jgi:hypothetical protein
MITKINIMNKGQKFMANESISDRTKEGLMLKVFGSKIFSIAEPPKECDHNTLDEIMRFIEELGEIKWKWAKETNIRSKYKGTGTESTTTLYDETRLRDFVHPSGIKESGIEFLIRNVWDVLMHREVGKLDCVGAKRWIKIYKSGNNYLIMGKDYVCYQRGERIIVPHPIYPCLRFGIEPAFRHKWMKKIMILGEKSNKG